MIGMRGSGTLCELEGVKGGGGTFGARSMGEKMKPSGL
jgi:hypothetical protein